MNINLTLIGQSIAFAVFVWFCMKYIWPPLLGALEERKTRIADGLAAAEEGLKARERAEEEVDKAIGEAREQAKDIIANAHKRANEIVEESRSEARVEGEKIKDQAKSEIEQEINEAREALRTEVVALALAGAEQVLGREVDAAAHDAALEKLAAEL